VVGKKNQEKAVIAEVASCFEMVMFCENERYFGTFLFFCLLGKMEKICMVRTVDMV
jgi:hypothetical protein